MVSFFIHGNTLKKSIDDDESHLRVVTHYNQNQRFSLSHACIELRDVRELMFGEFWLTLQAY